MLLGLVTVRSAARGALRPLKISSLVLVQHLQGNNVAENIY